MSLSVLVNSASVISAFFGCILCLFRYRSDLSLVTLEKLISYALAASSFPMGIILIISGVFPHIIMSLDGLNIYYSLAGLSLTFVSIKTLFA